MSVRTGVPRTVKGLSVVSLFNDLASEMVYPLLPALVTGPLGGGALVLGLLDGAAELTSAVLKVVSGRLSDRTGWRAPLILVGYATAVLVRPLISVANAAWQVVGFRVIDRVGKGLRTPARDAWIAAVTPPDRRGRAFGFHRAADHFGAVLGSVAAWLLLERGLSVRDVIGWSAVPGILACLVLIPMLRRADPDRLAASAERRRGRRPGRRHRPCLLGAHAAAGRVDLPSVARGLAPAPTPGSRCRRGGHSAGVGGPARRQERQLLPGRVDRRQPRTSHRRGRRADCCSRPWPWCSDSGCRRRWRWRPSSCSVPSPGSPRPRSARWSPGWYRCGRGGGSGATMG